MAKVAVGSNPSHVLVIPITEDAVGKAFDTWAQAKDYIVEKNYDVFNRETFAEMVALEAAGKLSTEGLTDPDAVEQKRRDDEALRLILANQSNPNAKLAPEVLDTSLPVPPDPAAVAEAKAKADAEAALAEKLAAAKNAVSAPVEGPAGGTHTPDAPVKTDA